MKDQSHYENSIKSELYPNDPWIIKRHFSNINSHSSRSFQSMDCTIFSIQHKTISKIQQHIHRTKGFKSFRFDERLKLLSRFLTRKEKR